MWQLISMFILGFVFGGCLMALFVIHNLMADDDAQNEHLEEMSEWYTDTYGEDDDQC